LLPAKNSSLLFSGITRLFQILQQYNDGIMTLTTITLLLLPFITAFIGWLTNWFAIKMLFHPRHPMKLPLLGHWQGLIPRRQHELAGQAAEIIEREIISHHIISGEIRKMDLTPYLTQSAGKLVRDRLVPRLKKVPFVGSFMTEENIARMESAAHEEICREAKPAIEKMATAFEAEFNVKDLVEERIKGFDLGKLEEIVMEVARNEFKTIEYLGALIGFFIGLVQLALLYATGSLQF